MCLGIVENRSPIPQDRQRLDADSEEFSMERTMGSVTPTIRSEDVVVFIMCGGVFDGVLSDVPGLRVIVIDWDDIREGDSVGPPLTPDSLSFLADETRSLVAESLLASKETACATDGT
jgi:hypothetical protein